MTAPKNLIINYVPQHCDENYLMNIFSQVGPIESCRVMRDFKTGYSYGFGFINYVRPEDAEKAILHFNGYEICNKRLKVSYARPPGDRIKDTNLYITNLPKKYTEDDLESMFGKFGKIVQKNLLLDKTTGVPRGVAFVRFDNRDDAQKAIQELNGAKLEGCSAGGLSVRVAEEHGKLKAIYYAGWHASMYMQQNRVLHQRMNQQRMNHRQFLFPNNVGCVSKRQIPMIRGSSCCIHDRFDC